MRLTLSNLDDISNYSLLLDGQILDCFSRKLFAITLVFLLPVVLLAISGTIEGRFASRADFVLTEIALRG